MKWLLYFTSSFLFLNSFSAHSSECTKQFVINHVANYLNDGLDDLESLEKDMKYKDPTASKVRITLNKRYVSMSSLNSTIRGNCSNPKLISLIYNHLINSVNNFEALENYLNHNPWPSIGRIQDSFTKEYIGMIELNEKIRGDFIDYEN